MLSLGIFPDVSLAAARAKRDEFRTLLAEGINPSAHRKAEKLRQADDLDSVFAAWHERKAPEWNADHAERNKRRYEIHVAPILGHLPIREISPPDILGCLDKIRASGTLETAHRVRGVLSLMFDHLVALGVVPSNPARALSRAIPPTPRSHYPAPVTPDAIRELLAKIWDYPGSIELQSAIRLGAYLAVRPGELRHMKWSELDGSTWNRVVTKINQPMATPLSTQVVELLEEMRLISGNGLYVLPNARSPHGNRPMSNVAVLAAYRRVGVGKDEAVGHSWRAAMRTVGDEILGFRPEVLEMALGHAVKDALGRAYNRTTLLDERARLAQEWADWLDDLRGVDPWGPDPDF